MQRTLRGNLGLPLSALILVAIGSSLPVEAAGPPCNPCIGIAVDDIDGWLAPLAVEPELGDEERLFVAWSRINF